MSGLARRLAVLGLIVVVLALVLVSGVRHWETAREARLRAQQNEVILTKADSPNAQSASENAFGNDLRGKTAPSFTLTDMSGKKVSLADYKGHPVIVNFWATYCGPCKLEMPWFEEFRKKYAAQGLVVLGLDEEDGVTKEQVQKAAERTGVTYPILIANDKLATLYGLGDYLPVTFFVDKNGTIVEQAAGVGSKDEMEANVRKITGGL
jgi:thiol-disulfide isomerase/thioredoxin